MNIIIELDSDEITVLKEGGTVCKETDNPDLPVLFIYKWDIAKEMQNGLDEREGLVDVLFEGNGTINRKLKKLKREGEECLEGTIECLSNRMTLLQRAQKAARAKDVKISADVRVGLRAIQRMHDLAAKVPGSAYELYMKMKKGA